MVRISVLYPNKDGARFDFDYFTGQHFDLVKNRLGATLAGVEVNKGLGSAAPGHQHRLLRSGTSCSSRSRTFNKPSGPTRAN
ncbi:MAG: EthD family reductase [Chloroflexota bacterium]